MTELIHGDCIEVLRSMPDCSVDAVVTDPPYGLSFMNKKWDYDVPSVEVWAECLRVLKPGGHLLAFAGTRTQHRMAVRIEDAGFEIRDMIAWVYGCLSEDTEILTENGWMLYNKAKNERVLTYDIQKDIYQWEKPSRWNEYRVESDTAYRIQSDYTDQIVSKGHRCLVERCGELVFVQADELASLECVPYLRSDFSALPQGRSELLLQNVLRESQGLAETAFSERQREEATRHGACDEEEPSMEGRTDIFQAQGQVCRSGYQVRSLSSGNDKHGSQGRVCNGASDYCGDGNWQTADAAGMRSPYQSRCYGQQTGKPNAVCDQCRPQEVRARTSYQTTVATVTAIEYSGMIWCPTVSTGAFVARRNGKVFITGNSGFPKSLDVSKAIDKQRDDSEDIHMVVRWIEARRVESGVTRAQVEAHFGTQNIGQALFTITEGSKSRVATWEQWIELKSLLKFDNEMDAEVWRLNGRKGKPGEAFAEREVVGTKTAGMGSGNTFGMLQSEGDNASANKTLDITAPATDAAKQWQGWGTALKPALEPITVARKPLIGTVAENVLQHGTGAINVDGGRVGKREKEQFIGAKNGTVNSYGNYFYEKSKTPLPDGRWPANFIHDGSEEVVGLFPQTKSGKMLPQHTRTTNGSPNGIYGKFDKEHPLSETYGDSGSAARFFFRAEHEKEDLLFCRAKAILSAWKLTKGDQLCSRENASVAESSLCLSRQAAVSVLSDAVIAASRGDKLLSDVKGLSTTVTGSEFEKLCETLITAMLISESAALPAPSQDALIQNGCRVSVAAIQKPTDTMTITISLPTSDGYAEPVTFSIIPSSMDHGAKDLSADRFRYCAKASKADRNEGMPEGTTSNHPTVKPTDLMRYLCRLVTPPGGVVLDPFMGSGSTGKAAALEGFSFIGIEREAEYVAIAQARINHVTND